MTETEKHRSILMAQLVSGMWAQRREEEKHLSDEARWAWSDFADEARGLADAIMEWAGGD